MSINNQINRTEAFSNNNEVEKARIPPEQSSVSSFNQEIDKPKEQKGESDKSSAMDPAALQMLISLIQQLIESLQGSGSGQSQNPMGNPIGGSIADSGTGGVSPVEGSGSAGSNEKIPPPSEHIQTMNLGGKQVTIGGDGTASAAEVQATANSIQNLYQNSPTFKNMIDSSSDPSFEVSVGKRSDNTSWGNTTGKVFMNINNVSPGNSDSFQSLLGHEFAHASIDLGHGSAMEQLQTMVAQEA